MNFYILWEDIPFKGWGDYGITLAHGSAEYASLSNERTLEILRTGPYIPPVTLIGGNNLVVTDSLKKDLQSSELVFPSFRRVIKKKIIALHWETWDWNSKEPKLYPLDSEPWNYIEKGEHNPLAAQKMGDVWFFRPEEKILIEKIYHPQYNYVIGIKMIGSSWNGSDFFGADDVLYTIVSERAKNWLEARFSDWLRFQKLEII